jgi:hypothetical protein
LLPMWASKFLLVLIQYSQNTQNDVTRPVSVAAVTCKLLAYGFDKMYEAVHDCSVNPICLQFFHAQGRIALRC